MKSVFDPILIGNLQVKNRIVRSATAEMFADEEKLLIGDYLSLYRSLAEGGVGTIITGLIAVDRNARVRQWMPRADSDSFIEDFRSIADAVHAHGCKIVVQLAHSGGMNRMTEGDDRPMSASEITMIPDKPAREMTKQDIADVVESYAKAAAICKEADADGVQIHGAHGYLVTQFLSPFYNKRTDNYGGGIENRGRIVIEMVDAMRDKTGDDYPLWIKINCKDLVEESITPAEFIWLCKELEKHGLNAIEVSAGVVFNSDTVPFKMIRDEADEGTFAPEALTLAEEVSIPVISTGGFRTPDVIDGWLNKGHIAAIGLCRPLICEPGLINRWQAGDKGKARCLSCNKCLMPKDGFGCKAFPA
ncbi:MAG: NADH:flavin oxidoreductase [Peptococcaceae bacterium]|nr:NADH:flavin oxidoreductase [Peptococcaceae bacterium]